MDNSLYDLRDFIDSEDLTGLHCQEAGSPRMSAKRYSNVPPAYSQAVARRNERERNRVRQVNNGFVVLRQKIPFAKSNKKMSKVETLRCAVDYIRQLQQLLSEEHAANQESSATAFSSSTMSPPAYASPSTSPVAYPSSTTSPSSSHSVDMSNDALSNTQFYQQNWFTY